MELGCGGEKERASSIFPSPPLFAFLSPSLYSIFQKRQRKGTETSSLERFGRVARAPASHYLAAGAGVCVCACESAVRVSPSLPVSPLSPPHTPASATSVSSPCQFLPLLLLCVKLREGVCVPLKRPTLGQRAGRSERGQGRGAGRAESFGVLTKAKGEQSRPATGKFGND